MLASSRGHHASAPLLPHHIPGSPSSTAPSATSATPRRQLRRLAAVLSAVLVLWLIASRSPHPTSDLAYASDDSTSGSSRDDEVALSDTDWINNAPFNPRRPCNALTESFVTLSPDSPTQRFLSPSPPLPPDAPLSARLDDWLSAPLATQELWTQFNKQTCANPSVRRTANSLHVRESSATWAGMDVERVRGIREEFAGVLRAAQDEGRLPEWTEERKSTRGTRGIVWTAGNADTFDRVLTSLRLLRHAHACTLPAHVFHFSSESPSAEQVDELSSLNATVSPLVSVDKDEQGGRTKSFHLKGAALVQAPFDEVLLLDSDNVPVRDVATLFDSPEFGDMGAVLWSDFFKDQPENAIWSILGVQCRDEWSTESGQLLVRRSQHLDVLLLVEHMLRDWRFWFRFSDGDKDLFRYAFIALRKRWAVPARHLSSASWSDPAALGWQHRDKFAGHTMVQYGLASETGGKTGGARPLFVHANLLKRVQGPKLHDGNTWGRTLRLRLPPDVPPDEEAPDAPPFILTADALANVSPLTGLGIPSTSTSSLGSTPIPRSVRARALLERGLAMHFWAGYRAGGAYVLAVESSWADELADVADWSGEEKEGGEPAGEEDDEERLDEGEREIEAWGRLVTRERGAHCGDASEPRLRDELLGTGEGAAGWRGPQMEVIAWADDPDLRDFERLYYGIGRGKGGGTGFR